MKYWITSMLLLVHTLGYSQSKKKQDIEAIRSMSGCFEVRFNFAETFSPDAAYEFHDNYSAGALEYVLPVEETKDKIVLQHLLVIGDTLIIKHWRQDWLFENTDFYTYYKHNSWKYRSKQREEVRGQWTQKVYQVDDGPRYEGTGSWIHQDGRHFWESTADAPLPRREFSKRSDYNVMKRRNRHEIVASGWIHEQDNDKILREDKDLLLAQEKGWNSYQQVEESKCKVASDWWEKNQLYWSLVRGVWQTLFNKNDTLSLNMKVDDKILFQRLFSLGDQYTGQDFDQGIALKEIKRVISLHLAGKSSLAIN